MSIHVAVPARHRGLLLLGLLACGIGCGTHSAESRRGPLSGRLEVIARLVPSVHGALDPEVLGDDSMQPELVTLDGASYPAVTVDADGGQIVWPVTLVGTRARLETGIASLGDPAADELVELSVTLELAGGDRHELWSGVKRVRDLQARAAPLSLEIDTDGTVDSIVLTSRSPPRNRTPVRGRIAWLAPRVLVPEPPSVNRPNIVVVCVDTLRADRVEGEGNAMPLLEERLGSAIRFPRAYASSSWTLPSIASLLTGLRPSVHQAGRRQLRGPADSETDYSARPVPGGIELTIRGKRYHFGMLHPSFETLQDLLGAAGYQTLAIHSNGYVDPPTGVLDGMDQVIHYPPQAHAGTNAALRHLGSLSETRFFLFLHYIDPHQWPTLLPESLRDRVDPGSFSSRERGEVLRIYDDLVRTVDIELERFLSALDARSLASDTVIVFLSDHGERFFEKGVVGSHGGSHYESVLRVPLAIWLPGHPGEDVPTRVSLVDVTPTLLEMAGIEAPGSLVGTSLMPLIRATATADREVDAGLVLWSAEEAALVTGHWKYVCRPGQGDLLFDLEADPGENHNLVGRHPALASELRTRLVARSRADRKRSEDLEYPAVFLQKPTLDSLRALGYVD